MKAHQKETIYVGGERYVRTVRERTRMGRGTGRGSARIGGRTVPIKLASTGIAGRWWVPAPDAEP